MTVLFFALSGLDILNALDEISDKEKLQIINWIYSLQVSSSEGKVVTIFLKIAPFLSKIII